MTKKWYKRLFILYVVTVKALSPIGLVMVGLDTLAGRLSLATGVIIAVTIVLAVALDVLVFMHFACPECGHCSNGYAYKVIGFRARFFKEPKLLICPKCGAQWDFGGLYDEK